MNNTKSTPRAENGFVRKKAEIIMELKKQMKLAGPLIVVSFLQFSLLMISIIFLGHLNDQLTLSSASMATSFATVTGFTFLLGMGSALVTLCGQSYGAKQYHMLGIHMQRAMLVLSLLGIPIGLLWGFTEQIFILLKQDPQISYHAGVYARWLILSLLPYSLLQCQFRFLQTQNKTLALMVTAGLTNLIHVLSCWTLIFKLGIGYKGAAISIGISYWMNVLMLAIYIRFSPACGKTWTGFSKDGLKNLKRFIELGIPSAFMFCSVQWAYEGLVLASGLLPNPTLESSMMSVSLNITVMVFRIPTGLNCTISTRVSNELGAGRPYVARLAAQVVLFLTVTQGLLLSVAAVVLRDKWCYLYTNDEAVLRYMASIMPILALSNFIDGFQCVLSGTLTGCGRQKIVAIVNLGAYYFVGVPCAVVLVFVFHIGGKGFWLGIIFGSGLQAFLLLGFTIFINWEKEAKKAQERIFPSTIPTIGTS